MSAGSTSWLPLAAAVLGAVGFGTVTGSVITTYGGRARERRKARSKVMSSLERFETGRAARPLRDGIEFDRTTFAELNSRCIIAGVPRNLVALYQEICQAHSRLQAADEEHREPLVIAHIMGGFYLSDQAARLIQNALLHPFRSRLLRWWRFRRLQRKAADFFSDTWRWDSFESLYHDWHRLSGRSNRSIRFQRIRAIFRLLPTQGAAGSPNSPSGKLSSSGPPR